MKRLYNMYQIQDIFKYNEENELLKKYINLININDYSATFEPLVSLELCQLFRGSCATQFG